MNTVSLPFAPPPAPPGWESHLFQQRLRRRTSVPWLSLLLLLLPFAVEGQFSYVRNNGTITITGYTGAGGDVLIPDTIDTLPVTRIRETAFFYAYGVSNVSIPDSLTTIDSMAFYYCSNLTSVIIPGNVTNIGPGAFLGCTSLSAIGVDTRNSFYSSVDGVLFDVSQRTLIEFPGGRGGNYTIPSGVTNIGEGAFQACTSLTYVTIPDSVTKIMDWAFSSCTSLSGVTLPNSITSIGYRAFIRCGSLNSVIIPSSVTHLGSWAFTECTNLTSVALSDSLTSIRDEVFGGCSLLTNVVIPNKVTSIGNGAFRACTSLGSVTVPNSVTNISYGAFYACNSLSAITVEPLNPFYRSVDGVLFNKSQTLLIQYPGAKAGTYTVPVGVRTIGADAFTYCYLLSSVTIANSVTLIEQAAFFCCTNLTSVTIPGSVTSLEYGAFSSCRGLTNLNIENGLSRIGDGAFSGCSSLSSVTIPNSVGIIEDEAFRDCLGLQTVYFRGNAPWSIGVDLFSGADSAIIYYFPGTWGWHSTFAARPTALWRLPYPVMLSFGIYPDEGGTNVFGFTISWATNASVVVEASTNLANSAWSPVGTNMLTDGWSYFSDPWTNSPVRFYRIRSP